MSSQPAEPAAAVAGADSLSLRRWFLIYGVWLAALAVPAAILLHGLPGRWQDLFLKPGDFTSPAQQALKVLIFACYLSLCTTFLPLPTTWLVAGLAARHAALSPSLAATALILGAVGAAASSMANTTDFHLFTWLLRSRRVARVRDTALYRRSARWFQRRPFSLVAIFNVIPIPVDVVRMLAATHRYPLRPFFAANFIGRFLRYATVAVATFLLGPRGWLLSLALLALAVVLGAGRLAMSWLRRQ